MKNIVFIIGNGFDLDLGLQTSYASFCKSEHCPSGFPAPIIKHLNERWPGDKSSVRWYDLENELFVYQQKMDKQDLITDEEREYLRDNPDTELHKKYWYTGADDMFKQLWDKGVIISKQVDYHSCICAPNRESLLLMPDERDRLAVEKIKQGLGDYLNTTLSIGADTTSMAYALLYVLSKSVENGNDVKLFSFNYTPLPSPYNESLHANFYHVHGSSKDHSIILGTGDFSQPDPRYDFLQKSFDSKYAPPALVYDLQAADEVIVFGHSLGVNDRQYFKSFFKKQSSAENPDPKRKTITIFTRDDQSEVEIKRSLQQMSDNNLASLYGMNDLKIIKTSNLRESQRELRAFLERHIGDGQHAYEILGQLL